MLSFTKLEVRSMYRKSNVYLLPSTQNRNLNSKMKAVNSSFAYFKSILRRSKINQKRKCLEYSKLGLGCNDRHECIDQCRNFEFYKIFKTIYHKSVIIKDHFTEKCWQNLNFQPNKTMNSSYHKYHYNEIKKVCTKRYSSLDCEQVRFGLHLRVESDEYIKEIELPLNNETVCRFEEEPSLCKLLLDILNLQIILVGINGRKLIRFLNRLFNFHHLIYVLLLSAGLFYHLYFIFDHIINGEMIFSEHFEIQKAQGVPVLILCLDYSESIAFSNKSKDFLDKLNKDLAATSVFESIRYFDESNRWTMVNKSNYLDQKILTFRTFYISNKKCFRIILKSIYKKNQFGFEEYNEVLKIYLNRSTIHEKNRKIVLLTRPKTRLQFSKAISLKFNKLNENPNRYILKQEKLVMTYYDRFEFLKHPISFFRGNKESLGYAYLIKLVNNLERNHDQIKFNSSKEQNRKIDELLNKIYSRLLFEKNKEQSDYDFRKYVTFNVLRSSQLNDLDDPDIVIRITFFLDILQITNRDTHIKLILNIISCFSFWLEFAILDLHFYAFKIKHLLVLKRKFLACK